MEPTLLLVDMTDENLTLARQSGAESIVAPFDEGYLSPEGLGKAVSRVESFGLRISVIERFLPHDKIVHGLPGRGEQVAQIKKLIECMGTAGIEVLCYNWMPSDDWTRTSVDEKERGGSLVTEFDVDAASANGASELAGRKEQRTKVTSREELWENLRAFLDDVIPVCEMHGVSLAMHPDDPPLASLNGEPQIVYSVREIEKVTSLHSSPCNGICFCQGTFASGGEDIPSSIRRLGKYIKFVHCRDVVMTTPGMKFRESWQDTGDTDMVEAMRAYREVLGPRRVPIRPDHVPTMEGEDNSRPGYHMMGRLFALGYLKGLMEAVGRS